MARADGPFAVRGAIGLRAVQCRDAGDDCGNSAGRWHFSCGDAADARLLWLRLYRDHRTRICHGADVERGRYRCADSRTTPAVVLVCGRRAAGCCNFHELSGSVRGLRGVAAHCRCEDCDHPESNTRGWALPPRRSAPRNNSGLCSLAASRSVVSSWHSGKRALASSRPSKWSPRWQGSRSIQWPTCSADCRFICMVPHGAPSSWRWPFCRSAWSH